MITGRDLRALRLAKGISIRKLAGLLGVSKQTVVNLEQGHNSASIDFVQKYLSVIGYDIVVKPL